MSLLPALQTILRSSKLSFEEVRAFEAGLSMLTDKEQRDFFEHISRDPELIYPIYIHYKAKARAIRGTEAEWKEAVEHEVEELEEYMSKKHFGDEITQ